MNIKELKFRAWDTQNNCFEYDNDNLIRFFKLAYYDSTTEIEQCTGMKDKNGKDIYVGDIVVLNGDTIEFYNKEIVRVVEFKNGAFQISGYNINLNCFTRIEVIDNIHEHKHDWNDLERMYMVCDVCGLKVSNMNTPEEINAAFNDLIRSTVNIYNIHKPEIYCDNLIPKEWKSKQDILGWIDRNKFEVQVGEEMIYSEHLEKYLKD